MKSTHVQNGHFSERGVELDRRSRTSVPFLDTRAVVWDELDAKRGCDDAVEAEVRSSGQILGESEEVIPWNDGIEDFV